MLAKPISILYFLCENYWRKKLTPPFCCAKNELDFDYFFLILKMKILQISKD